MSSNSGDRPRVGRTPWSAALLATADRLAASTPESGPSPKWGCDEIDLRRIADHIDALAEREDRLLKVKDAAQACARTSDISPANGDDVPNVDWLNRLAFIHRTLVNALAADNPHYSRPTEGSRDE